MAMTEISLRQPLRYTIDLGAGLVQQPMRSQLMKGDKKANRVIVHLTDGGKDVTLSGVTVTGSFIRPPDAAEIPLTGETSGSEAIVTLDDACYSTEGYCEISVKLTVGETSRTILTLTGYVLSKGSGAYVDVSGVIPNIDDVIAQYAEMKRVTQETQAAGTAAGNAAGAADTAADEANRQAQAAQQAAAKIDGLTVSAEKANEAGAEVSQKDGAYHVNFKLPKGDTGATPDITFEVATGAAGSDVQIEQSGTPEAPHIKLTIPRGDTGAVEGVDYYEGNPEALGTASPGTANGVARGNHVHPKPTPGDIGAASIDDITPGAKTTYSSEKIEGELSSLSQQIADVGTLNLLVNSNFQAPYLINLNGKTEYVEAGETVSGWLSDSLQLAVSVNDDGIVLTNKKTSGTRTKLESVVRGVVPGETYTLAVKTESELCVTAATLLNNATSSDVEYAVGYMLSGGYFCVTAKANNSGFTVSFRTSNNTSTHKIKWAALVPGTYTAENFPTPIWLHPRLEMIRMGLPVNPVNLLDNSYFERKDEIVNQRGQTSYTALGYTIDRWRFVNNNGILAVGDGFIGVSSASGSGVYLMQRIPKGRLELGKTYTLTVCDADGKVTVKSGTLIKGVSIPVFYPINASTGAKIGIRLDYDSSTDLYNVLVSTSDTLVYQIKWIALYEGAYTLETLPPYRPKENELAACQRYAIMLADQMRIRAASISANTIEVFIPLPTSLRDQAAPSFEQSNFAVYNLSGEEQTGFTFSIVRSNMNGVLFRATKTSHGLTDAEIRTKVPTLLSRDL